MRTLFSTTDLYQAQSWISSHEGASVVVTLTDNGHDGAIYYERGDTEGYGVLAGESFTDACQRARREELNMGSK